MENKNKDIETNKNPISYMKKLQKSNEDGKHDNNPSINSKINSAELDVQDPGGTYISIKQQMQTREKQILAKFVVNKYIKDLHAVGIDAGSTSQQIIEQMMLHRKFLSILTNNMTAFRQNSKQNVELTANEFILTGGKYVALFDALLGNETINSFRLFHPHIVIIGVSGFIPNKGFFCHGNDEKVVKELLFSKGNNSKVIIPVDYSKLGRSDSYLFGDIIGEQCNFEVVMMPPLPPNKPDRTDNDEIDNENNRIYQTLKKEYKLNLENYKKEMKDLTNKESSIAITIVDEKNNV